MKKARLKERPAILRGIPTDVLPMNAEVGTQTVRQIRPPRIVPGGVYSEQDLIHNFGCREDYFRKARRLKVNPLKPLPTNTKQFFYLYDQVLAFWTRSSTGDEG